MNLSPGILASCRDDFDKYFSYGNVIGKGKYANVKECFCKISKQCFAAKIIRRARSYDNRFKLNVFENEVKALKLVQYHPSIVRLYDVFQTKDEFILLLEYASERDLQHYLGLFEEEKACQIIYQVLKAIEFLHSKNILHLDIKPENVLIMFPMPPIRQSIDGEDDEHLHHHQAEIVNERINNENQELLNGNGVLTGFDNVKVKLCDFSFSQVMVTGKKILGMMGTVTYSAPEVLEYDPLSKATDMWSLGVLTHVLLSSYTPFGNGDDGKLETQTNILNTRNEEFVCEDEYFENLRISDEAKLFIESLLRYIPRERLTVEEALDHDWFKKFNIHSTLNTINDNNNNNNPPQALFAALRPENSPPQALVATLRPDNNPPQTLFAAHRPDTPPIEANAQQQQNDSLMTSSLSTINSSNTVIIDYATGLNNLIHETTQIAASVLVATQENGNHSTIISACIETTQNSSASSTTINEFNNLTENLVRDTINLAKIGLNLTKTDEN